MYRLLRLLVLLAISIPSLAQVPSVGSTNIVFSSTYCNRTNVSWDVGDGDGRIVVCRKGAPVTTQPNDNVYYIARDTFGSVASKIGTGTGEHVVYNGSGNSVIVFGLESNTTYYFAVFEFNGAGSTFSYKTDDEPSDSVTTEWINVDFSIDDPHQCENVDTFTFTANVSQSLNNPLSYNWSFGDTKTDTGYSVQHSYTKFGKFTVKLTATSLGCVGTFQRIDTVAPLPIVAFSLDESLNNNDTIQCYYNQDGSQNKFSFVSNVQFPYLATGYDFANYYWYFGDGDSSTQLNARNKRYDEPGIYRVSLIVRASKNKYIDWCVDSSFMYVEVKDRPLDSTKIFFSDTSMCLESNRFEFVNRSGVVAQTSTWYFGDGNSMNGDSVWHSYATPGMYNVLFEIIDTAGCYDKFSDSVEVVPQPNNFFNGLDPYYCQNNDKVFLDPNLGKGTFYGDNVDYRDSSFIPSQLGVNEVSYIYKINNCIDTFTLLTEVFPEPELDLRSDTSICEGTSIDLYAQKDSSTLEWSTGESDSIITVDQAGLYWVLKEYLFNGSHKCSTRDSVNVSVIEPPIISLGSDSTLCGGSVRYIDLTTSEATYTWSDGYVGPTRTIDQTGVYWVTVENKCGIDQDTVDLTVLPYACEIYIPNAFSPNGDNLNDVFRPIGQVEVTKMMIFNRWGEILYNSDESGNEYKFEWDGYYMGKRVQTGAYFYAITYLVPEGNFETIREASGPVYIVY